MIITDSKFKNNQASDQGGAILNRSGTLNLINCEFTENIAKKNGSIYNMKGFISKLGEIKVENCKFKNNKPNDEY